MCGIVGYWSIENEALPILLNSLKKLEYRGYDSFGFATIHNNSIHMDKQTGKISEAKCRPLPGKIGVGHTRWATHGGVSEKNSHPHKDCTGNIAVAHNGIVENFQQLKKELIEKGHNFVSDTDTEVLPHLIEDFLKNGKNLREAVIETSRLIEGRNAFIVLKADSNELIACRNGSPLIVGLGNDGREVFVASDIPAFLDKTKKVMYIDDNQLAVIKQSPEFYDMKNNSKIEKRIIVIDWNPEQAEKGDYEHFMLKEIMEQKQTIANSIEQNDAELMKVAEEINNARGVFFIGCGTAAKVCQTAEYLFSKIADRHVNFITASEFNNYKHFLLPETLIIAVSQSGETADVLDALKIAKQKGSKVISIVNSPMSSITRISDYTFLIKAGPEKAIASTKATTAQLAVIILLAYACAGKLREGDRMLVELAGKVNDMLNPRYGEHIKNLAEKLCNENLKENQNVFIIGRGVNYPIAKEAAIKIMEVSYFHAQGFAGGELKHGPIALIDKNTPVIVLVANDENKESILSNAIEVKSRGAHIVGVSPFNNEAFDYWIKTPDVNSVCSPIASLIPIQLLAYYLGTMRGFNVDYPRNLAKSVTVK